MEMEKMEEEGLHKLSTNLFLPIIAVVAVLVVSNCLTGKGGNTKSDEFLEKFQTAFDLPPLIFGKSYCNFFVMDMVVYMQGGMMARWYEMHACDLQR